MQLAMYNSWETVPSNSEAVMASSLSFQLAATLLFVLVHQLQTTEALDLDLDKTLERFAHLEAKKYNTEVESVDIKIELQKSGLDHVTVSAGPVKYGNAKSPVTRRNVVYTKVFENGSPSAPQKFKLSKTTEYTNRFRWNVKDGFQCSTPAKTTAGFPFFAQSEFKREVGLGLKAGVKEYTETKKFTLDEEVTVPPMKVMKIDWILTESTQEVPWTVTLNITGWFRVTFKGEVKGSNFWPYPVGYSEQPPLKMVVPGKVQYTVRGTFKGVTAHETRLRITESDFDEEYSGKSSGVRNFTIPLPLTQLKPGAKTM